MNLLEFLQSSNPAAYVYGENVYDDDAMVIGTEIGTDKNDAPTEYHLGVFSYDGEMLHEEKHDWSDDFDSLINMVNNLSLRYNRGEFDE